MIRRRFISGPFAGLVVLIFLTACGTRAATPTSLPTQAATAARPAATATPTALPSLTQTAAPEPPTPTPPAPAEQNLLPTPYVFQRPAFGDFQDGQIQILAQWSSGASEARYAWSPDGSKLLMASPDAVRVVDMGTFQSLWEIPVESVSAGSDVTANFSSDGSQVKARMGSKIVVLNSADGQPAPNPESFSPYPQPQVFHTEDKVIWTNSDSFVRHQVTIRSDRQRKRPENPPEEDECTSHYLRGLPDGLTGYSFSPDNRLILVTAKEEGHSPAYQALILGINSGSESPLPAKLADPLQPGFHPTRPGLGAAPAVPVYYSPILGQRDDPPLIATPTGPLSAYRLKPWNEQSGVEMLKQVIAFATANDVFGPASGRGRLYDAQDAIRIAGMEYLSRFPNAPDRTAVEWRLAMSDTISKMNKGSDSYDGWIAKQIETALNQGAVTPDDISLNAALAPFDFYVNAGLLPVGQVYACPDGYLSPRRNPFLIRNLFGDGRQSQVMIVKTIGSEVGLVIAIHQRADGQYRVVPVTGQWDLYAGVGQEINAIDITGDGRPEIRVDFYWHNGSMNGRTVSFLQWQGKQPGEGQFVNIAHGSDNLYEDPMPEVKITGVPGAPKTLEFTPLEYFSYGRTETWKWNGLGFVSSSHIPFPIGEDESHFGYLKALKNGQYADLVNEMKSLPPDPWRTFFLGYVEALQFHPAHAVAALQPLADQAKTDSGNATARAAEAFLNAYHSGTDLYRACLAALQADNHVPCDTHTAFKELAGAVGRQSSDLPKALDALGVSLIYQSPLDANGDGKTDWLMIGSFGSTIYDSVEYRNEVWLAVSGPGGYTVKNLTYLSSEINDKARDIQLTPAKITGANGKPIRAFLLASPKSAIIFTVKSEGVEWRPVTLLDTALSESNFEIRSDNNRYSVVIFYDNTNRFIPPEIARWDPASESFLVSDYLEYLLLIEGRSDEAIHLIPGLLEKVNALPDEKDGFPNYSRIAGSPRLQYLLGLAYELSGDNENAARTYYDLWKRYPLPTDPFYGHPDQPYAIMARAKLEAISGQ